MKTWKKFTLVVASSATVATASAAGIQSVLDGMFINVTAPDVVSNQFRGAIAGGSIYVRSPISSIQVMAIDPPRISAGCGGIDLYLGSFSFITADKLTQFIRNVAQNAAPLAFKMAIDATFPQLGGVLDKFQHMAQMMNDSQRNSCQMARGLLDAAKNPEEAWNNLTKSVSQGVAAVSSWATDFTEALEQAMVEPSKNVGKTRDERNTDGTQVIAKTGNITWNALNVRKNAGFTYGITDDPHMAQQLLMSMMGTQVAKEGATPEAEPKVVQFGRRTRLKSLFNPTLDPDGNSFVPIWSCGVDTGDCLNPQPDVFATSGVVGFVRTQMYGSQTATAPLPGSIVYNMLNCTSSNCGMTAGQLKFLNAVGKIPTIGLLMRAQAAPGVISMITPDLVDAMVDEISVVYARAVIDVAITSYSSTELPKPESFDETVKLMMEDLKEVEMTSKQSLTRLNTMATYIDAAIRANGAVLRYRPH